MLRGALAAVELARRHGAEMRILSDANTLYIRRVTTSKVAAGVGWWARPAFVL